MSFSILILIATVFVSIASFNNYKLKKSLIFNAHAVYHDKQWYRVLTHGFIHADWIHLIVNMFVLFSFGRVVELYFSRFFNFDSILFVFFYLSAIVVSSLTSLSKYKNEPYFNSLGASGAVSAIVFASILFAPTQKVYIYGILGIPGYIFGPIYLYYSWYMDKKGNDNIGHDAHFVGAVYGLTFPFIMNHNIFKHFIAQF